MKRLLIGTATVVLLSGAAWADDSGSLRALDLLGEPPGAGAMGPNRGDVVFPDGPINTPFNRGGAVPYSRGGYYGMYGYGYPPGPFGLFGPPMAAGPGYYGYSGRSGYYGSARYYGPRSSMRSVPRERRGTGLPGERSTTQPEPSAGD